MSAKYGKLERIGRIDVLAVAVIIFMTATAFPALAQTAITTYHYNNNRTGWNQSETVLTPANVGTATFGLLQKVTLDDQVDAQPLVVPGMLITAGNFQGTHDVAYVATENNSVYAIDVHTGTVLLSPNFGTPVSQPLGCNNNGPNVGINSTPVIDLSSNTLYVMVYTQDSTGPAYRLHALDLGSLTDKVTPRLVTASHTLTDGSTFNFNATYQRQRPGLLLANGSVYAGFGSFCDFSANLSRGWLLGWTAGSLAPFPSNQMNDLQVTDPDSFFLSSIWMSGYGPATDDAGNVLFVTGNSDYSGTTYDGVTNIQESVVKVSSTLTSVVDLFTPKNQAALDQGDTDFGSGGVLVLPDQPGSTPHLAVAAGKDGNMYLMNEDHLGGYSPTTNNVLGTYSIGGCWCGPSYFVDPDGAGRVVSSGNSTVGVWKVATSPQVTLTNVTNSLGLNNGQDPGFFTSVSSNGTANPVIWALSRPTTSNNGAPISLYAFNPDSGGSTMTTLFSATAGAWPNTGGNANLVPVVANGLVFVASNQQLQIFGLTGGSTGATTTKLTSSLNPSVQGKLVTFTATVSLQSGTGTPTGNVTFRNGTAVLVYENAQRRHCDIRDRNLAPGLKQHHSCVRRRFRLQRQHFCAGQSIRADGDHYHAHLHAQSFRLWAGSHLHSHGYSQRWRRTRWRDRHLPPGSERTWNRADERGNGNTLRLNDCCGHQEHHCGLRRRRELRHQHIKSAQSSHHEGHKHNHIDVIAESDNLRAVADDYSHGCTGVQRHTDWGRDLQERRYVAGRSAPQRRCG